MDARYARVFDLEVGGYAATDVEVVHFRGKEAISRPFKFDVDFLAPEGDDVRAEQIVGARATFAFGMSRTTGSRGTTAGSPPPETTTRQRVVHGFAESVTILGTRRNPGRVLARVRIVPAIRFGKLKKTSRVFQGRVVPQVVEDICTAVTQGVVRGETRPYVAREYCVQYDESDLQFVRRILSEEGIYFYFGYAERGDGGSSEPMILADEAAAYGTQSSIPHLRLSPRGLGNMNDHTFALTHAAAANNARTKDYDFTRPMLDLQSAFGVGVDMPTIGAAVNEWAGVLQIDRYRGDYLKPDVEGARVALELDQLRRKAWVGRGTSTQDRLLPGYRFTLSSDDTPTLDGEYVITGIEHEGTTPELGLSLTETVYSNTFESIPSTLAFRPKRRKREPRQVIEPAVVVGVEKGTVYTDKYGRVRVQFPWDYAGSNNEHSTTWLRVIQGWAGASFGLQFIPRVGMEVMVSFLGGDPDCPVVVGAIHNGANPHPFHLPEQATRSGIRTETTPGGQGFNEISFEDQAGAEQVYIHAQRDLDEQVNRNHTLTVKKTQLVQIGDDQATSVKGNQDEVVGGRSSRVVGRDETVEIKAGRVTAIAGSDAHTIGGERRARVGSNDVAEVLGSASWTIGDDLTLRTTGCYTTIVGKGDGERSFTLHVEGTTDLYSREITEIASPKGLRLRCGNSLVEIMPDHVDIVSDKVMLRTEKTRITLDDDKLELWAKTQIRQKSDDELVLVSRAASINLKDEVKASGSKILLNSPDQAQDPAPIPPVDPTKFTVVDQDRRPLAYGRCVLVMADGSERSVALDKDGKAEVYGLEQSVKIVFPGSTDPGRG